MAGVLLKALSMPRLLSVRQRTITTGANCAKGAFSDSLLSRGGGQMHGEFEPLLCHEQKRTLRN